jgi:DNA-binding MarR family transcriptional regulator
MGRVTTTSPSAPARQDHATAVGNLVEEVSGLLRLVHALKASVSRKSAHSLLYPLTSHGPLRLTALAEAVHADPSTISRQVGELVKEDLVRREPDPMDRRACQLVVTQAGQEAFEALRALRTAAMARALGDWSTDEVEQFSASFHRFTTSLEQSLGGNEAVTTIPSPTSEESR